MRTLSCHVQLRAVSGPTVGFLSPTPIHLDNNNLTVNVLNFEHYLPAKKA